MSGKYPLLILCLAGIWFPSAVVAMEGCGMELLMTKLEELQDKLLKIELDMKEQRKEIEQSKLIIQKVPAGTEEILAQRTRCASPEISQSETMTTAGTPSTAFRKPIRSCREEPTKVSGEYLIQLRPDIQPFEVLCEQEAYGGGWTVFQHRFNGSVDFYRNWTEYGDGFGSLNGEFWLGLKYVHLMTSLKPHELIVEIRDFHGNYGYAHYDEFEVESKGDDYVLKSAGKYNGTAGDALMNHEGGKFITHDNDHGEWGENPAVYFHGGWWYNVYISVNLNGRYQNETDENSMQWYWFKEDYRGLAYSRMMIRERNSG